MSPMRMVHTVAMIYDGGKSRYLILFDTYEFLDEKRYARMRRKKIEKLIRQIITWKVSRC
jgi:hypothetical protein